MSETEEVRYIRGYIRAWAAMVVAGAFCLGVALIVIGATHDIPSTLANIFAAVGSSVIASLILYVLVSLLIDPRRQAAQAREALTYGIQAANRQFAERFEVALPTAVYEGSSIPKLAFRDAISKMIQASTRYDFKGDSANFTTYRLARCCDLPAVRGLDQIRLCILDPLSERAVKVYAEQYLRQDGRPYDAVKAAEKASQIKEDIYVSLWTLYRIRQRLTVSVFFHSDLPFFRCELFDQGMFLTYYLDRRLYPDYPETLQFAASTRPYRAYSTAVAVARKFAQKVVVFSETGPGRDLVDTDDKVAALLGSLGCQLSMDELDSRQHQRFQVFDKWLIQAGMSPSELF